MDAGLSGKVGTANIGLEQGQLKSIERKAGSAQDRETLRKSAKDFESIFVGMMLKSMRASIQKSGFLDGGNAEDIYKSMLDQEYSKMMSETGRMGLADTIERQLSRAAGWEIGGKPGEANISHLEKVKGLQAYGAAPLQSGQKESTIEVAKKIK